MLLAAPGDPSSIRRSPRARSWGTSRSRIHPAFLPRTQPVRTHIAIDAAGGFQDFPDNYGTVIELAEPCRL